MGLLTWRRRGQIASVALHGLHQVLDLLRGARWCGSGGAGSGKGGQFALDEVLLLERELNIAQLLLHPQIGVDQGLMLLLDDALGGQLEVAALPNVTPFEQLAPLVVRVGQLRQRIDAWIAVSAQDQRELAARLPLDDALDLCHTMAVLQANAHEAAPDQPLEVRQLRQQLQSAPREEQFAQIARIVQEAVEAAILGQLRRSCPSSMHHCQRWHR